MEDVLNLPEPSYSSPELRMFRETVDRFIEAECSPNLQDWREHARVDRNVWRRAGDAGLLMASAPAEFGGGGVGFEYEAVILERLGRYGAHEFLIGMQSLVFAPYILEFATQEQKRHWIAKLASGEWTGSIAMTEPSTGSDMQAIRTSARLDGDHYVINGQKTFITLGQSADLVMIACRTGEKGGRGLSLFIIETAGLEGFSRGAKLNKIGLNAHETAELYFDNVRVPASSLLGGEEGLGFGQMMHNLPQERLLVALESMAMIERALDETKTYTRQRKAFGKAILEFQNTQFTLAECQTEATIAKTFCEKCIELHLSGSLTGEMAAMAKYWVSDLQCKIVDRCLQLFGGYGYINEYPIAQMYKDARVSKIYGGTNEIMKLIIGRSL
jgi:acyl-CoA dehydrogenase